MDQSEEQNLKPDDTGNETQGVTSSLELGNVKHVLSVKMDTPDSHYTSITPLGKGSFGEVHSAHDTLLGREVAIKSLKQQFRGEEEIVDRFLKEARGTSQLEHPNIMPVHEMGVSDELGVYFAMKRIEGEDLKEILDRLEANTSFYLKKYPLNKLLEVFLAVCNGVAFAHSKGVIHRDLKPANIMIGEFGEVLILDWGLVKSVDIKEGSPSSVQLRMDEFDVGTETMDGAISGTPNYMSPEQAEGKIEDVNFQSDVYSLGAILYHILTYLPPFEKTQLRKLLENVKLGKFTPPRERRAELKIPKELNAICMKAMARLQVSRYRSVERLAEDIRNYIAHKSVSAYKAPRWVRFWNACRRHPVRSSVVVAVLIALGLAKTVQVSHIRGEYLGKLEDAGIYREKAEVLVTTAVEKIVALREIQDEAELKNRSPQELGLAEEIGDLVVEINKNYNLAVGFYEGIPERYSKTKATVSGYLNVVMEQIEFSLFRNDYNAAQQWLETAVERHEFDGGVLSSDAVAYTNKISRRIQGFGSLTVNEAPNMDELVIWPYIAAGSRLVQDDPIKRGTEFPVKKDKIRKGSYLIWITMSNGQFLPYPINIDHGEDLVLTPVIPDLIPDDMAYVPEGNFHFGGPSSRFYRSHKIFLPSFFIKKTEVTIGEYLEFWKTLDTAERKSECMSRIRYKDRERRYTDAWDADGTLDEKLSINFPVVGITLDAAEAFCRWKSVQLNQTVRLPSAQEWEKAARGVDGRIYPWGNGFDKNENLTLTQKNAVGKEKYPLWAPPGSFKSDVSVYNAFDMGGNVRELTSTPLPDTTELHQLKGGSASTPNNFLPCSNSSDTPVVPSDVGFRYLIEIPK